MEVEKMIYLEQIQTLATEDKVSLTTIGGIKRSQSEFYNAELPWDLTFAYSLTYGNNSREKKITGNSVMISGNVDLTPRWKIGVSTGYDFVQQGVTFTQFRFERDLLSWRMDFNWSPYGDFASWGFFIGIKSSVLERY
jgi:hypothetical protein